MQTKSKTFIGIFEDTDALIKKIEIPIIQRDYAQGRNTKEVKRIRDNFLDALYNTLNEDTKGIQLDFVYGNIIDGNLIPLDGQQRLTTLFLLHWYIAKKESIDEVKYSFLDRFTYKIRFSSQHFCEGLVKCSPDFSSSKLSNWIIDQNWFMYAWEYDPTIQSMLVMIDEIHSRFKETSDVWPKLNNVENPPISFYFLPLEDMGLTDSLYIKMNSRGKPLTNFEHFKAEFEKNIKQVSDDLYNEFTKKADIDWVDMLWKYRKSDNIIDDEFMNYFRFVTEVLCYLDDIEIVENDFELANSVYGLKNEDAEENLRFLFKSFDCWKDVAIDDFFKGVFSFFDYESGKVCLYEYDINLFKKCCNRNSGNFTLNDFLLLYGVLQYLINKSVITTEQFAERIRIVRNLIVSSPDEIRRDRFKQLLVDVKEIILNSVIRTGTLGFNEIQKKEELEKLSWRQSNKDLIIDLNQLEDHSLLRGSIAVIGLDELEKFKLRANSFGALFNKRIKLLKISKALLTIDNYSQLAIWRSFFGNEYDSSWRELFTLSKQRKNFDKSHSTLIKLLDQMKGEVDECLEDLISNYLNDTSTPKNWRYYFVKYPQMRAGKSGVYWWRNQVEKPYEIIMMNTAKSLNGKHWDPFLYVLYYDETLKGKFTLEEYNSPLFVKEAGQEIKCKNDNWEIRDTKSGNIESIEIPQQDGIDTVDRIELLKSKIASLLKQ